MPILPSRSCSSSPKSSCCTSYGCGRGPDTIIDKGRWRGGDNITTKRQREEAEHALAGPVQVDVVRAARLRRLVDPTNAGRETPMPPIPGGGGDNS